MAQFYSLLEHLHSAFQVIYIYAQNLTHRCSTSSWYEQVHQYD